ERTATDAASAVAITAGMARSCGRWHGQSGIATTFPGSLGDARLRNGGASDDSAAEENRPASSYRSLPG
ncbi:MAG: hypothetical protein ABS955_06130, partial [Stenotrophomonas maltophilia]